MADAPHTPPTPMPFEPTTPAPLQELADASTRLWVLVGAGQAHQAVLAHMAQAPWRGTPVVLVAAHAQPLCASRVAGFVAGHYPLAGCTLALEATVQRSGIAWIPAGVRSLDANAQTLTLDNGNTLTYAGLSIDTGALHNRAALEQAMAGARTHGLCVRPLEVFGTLWPQVAALGDQRALRIAVIGAGATGLELAMAVRQRLPHAAVTLLCGDSPPGARFGAAAQQRITAALRARAITVLHDRAVGLRADAVVLASGATLACDVPLLANGAQAPDWLLRSGLALDAHGRVMVDGYQRSRSHPKVFAAPNGRGLAHNLAAAASGQPLRAQPQRTLHLLDCGDRSAIACWGGLSAQGRWVGWLKNWLDRRACNSA